MHWACFLRTTFFRSPGRTSAALERAMECLAELLNEGWIELRTGNTYCFYRTELVGIPAFFSTFAAHSNERVLPFGGNV